MTLTSTAVHRRPMTFNTETLLRTVLALMFGLSCLSFIEPSPYEFFFFLLIPVTLLNGITVSRATIVLTLILTTIVVAQTVSLVPYIEYRVVGDNLTPSIYTMYTAYLYASAALFAFIFSRNTVERLKLCLAAYAFSCVFAGCWGILSFLDVAGLSAREPIAGRIAGPFKDPNVLGSYCVLGVTYLLQSALLTNSRFRLFKLMGAAITAFGGVFLSFSRGSWGAMIFAVLALGVSTYMTSVDRIMKRRILHSVAALGLLVVAGAVVVMTSDALRETVLDRAKLQQEYDGGETGRFGNQQRSIPMLLDRPLGFGPFRFPVYFGLQPHNSYIGAFADAGWVGGFAFLCLILTTSFLALRLAFQRSPMTQCAQVVCPAVLGLFLQALQIDIDHWRFIFLMIGAVWGMESMRQRLMSQAAASSPLDSRYQP